jgi:hypothetical protein
MKMKLKTFPKLQIILALLIIFLQFCQKKEKLIIDEDQFIEIYARLLIINELKVEKSFHDRLLQDLFNENNVTSDEIDSTVSYYNSNPKEWVYIYNRVREKILKIKGEYQTDSSKKVDSLRAKIIPKISTNSEKKSFIEDDQKKNKEQKQKVGTEEAGRDKRK